MKLVLKYLSSSTVQKIYSSIQKKGHLEILKSPPHGQILQSSQDILLETEQVLFETLLRITYSLENEIPCIIKI